MNKKRLLCAVSSYILLLLLWVIPMTANPFDLTRGVMFLMSMPWGAGIMAFSLYLYRR